MKSSIRFASVQDASEILRVYKSNFSKITIMHTRTPIPSLQQMEQQISEIIKEYPFLVCSIHDKIVGYCYACPGVANASIDRDVEFFVATDHSLNACGIATALCEALFQLLRLQNIQRVFGKIQAPNPRAEQLLIHFHFSLSNHFYTEVCMCGQQHDILWFDKWLHTYSKYPPAPKTVQELNQELCTAAFAAGLTCLDEEELLDCFH